MLIKVINSTQKKHIRVSDKTLSSWKKSYPWLVIEPETDNSPLKMKCSLCTEFNVKTIWNEEGSVNVQKSTIERHIESAPHIEASKLSVQRKICEESTSLALLPDDEVNNTSFSDCDVFLMRTVYVVMKEELPLDKVNALLDLQRINKVEMPYQNLSWSTVTEIQNIIAESLKKEIIDKINASKFFAVLIDESTDITVSKRLSVCVRYCYAGSPQTSFLGNIELQDGRAHTITEVLLKFLKECNIDATKCVSLATDGASVMMGRKSGVGVQIKSKAAPFCLQTHCVAHRLNLAVTDSVKNIDTIKKFSEKFGQLYNYFSASGNRTYTLKQMQNILEEPELTVKEPFSVRWLGLKRAVEAVYDCYGSILSSLSSLGCENDTKAKGLHKFFSSYKTALLLGFMLDVHTILGVFCCQLQQDSLIFSDVPALVDSTLNKLEFLKSNDGNGLYEMKASIEIHEEKASYKGEQLKNYSKESESQFENVKQQYLSNIIKNIKKRIPKDDCKVMLSLSNLLEPSVVQLASPEQTAEAIETLKNHYGTDRVIKTVYGDLQTSGLTETEQSVDKIINGEEVQQEWQGVIGIIKGTYKHLTLQDFCTRLLLKHQTEFPNMAKLAAIALCLQVTSVECERSFSTQNRIKSKFRYICYFIECLI